MLVLLKMRSTPNGCIGNYVVGDVVGGDKEVVSVSKAVRILEVVGQDGKILHNWLSDKLLTNGVTDWRYAEIEGSRNLLPEDVANDDIIKSYDRVLANLRIENAGLAVSGVE